LLVSSYAFFSRDEISYVASLHSDKFFTSKQSPSATDLSSPSASLLSSPSATASLRQYNACAYSDRDAATADDDLCTVRDLCAASVKAPALPDPSSLDQRHASLLAYARTLALVEPRFPVSADRAHVHSLSFTWNDAFKTSKKANLPSLHLERAAVFFNLAAVHSQIALAADRVTDVRIRTACGAFQSSAGAFALLRESGLAAKGKGGGRRCGKGGERSSGRR
jgi:hypothetical protein